MHAAQSETLYNLPMELLAQKLKNLRTLRKVNQVDVAVAVDVERATISKYETGGDVPGRETLMKLAQYYNVSLDWLASTTGDTLENEAGVVKSEQEALLLWAYRRLPEQEASAHLNLLISRANSIKQSS